MSTTYLALARSAGPGRAGLPRAAAKLAEVAVLALASAVLRRAARQSYRELAALDDRTLKDIGFFRSELVSIAQTVAETRTAAFLAQFSWTNPRTSA